MVWAKVLRAGKQGTGEEVPDRDVRARRRYLQNVHQRYPAYFREQMFHNLLVQKGYIVLDMDYRGSEGYTARLAHGHLPQHGPPGTGRLQGRPGLAGRHQQGDRDHGIYGGSYGGFMTFMALFRSPGTFKAGAALRPVVDWHNYNHGYTSNILNTRTSIRRRTACPRRSSTRRTCRTTC